MSKKAPVDGETVKTWLATRQTEIKKDFCNELEDKRLEEAIEQDIGNCFIKY